MRSSPDRENEADPQKKFIWLVSLLIFGRLLDFLATYHYSPNLAKEGNPLCTVFHFGWTGVIISNIFVSSIIIWFLYYDLFYSSKQLIPEKDNLTFGRFSLLYYFGERKPLILMILLLPYRWAIFFKTIGFVNTRLAIGGSIIAAVVWVSIYSSRTANHIYKMIYPHGLLALFVLATLYLYYLYFKREYQAYLTDRRDRAGSAIKMGGDEGLSDEEPSK